MIIRKKFKFEGAHIVRNCSSDRCKKSIHGHSYIVEIKLLADYLDEGGMVLDFGLLKGPVKDIVDSFDHAYSMWDKETKEFQSFIKGNSARYVRMPVSPSAENYAIMFAYLVQRVILNTKFQNGEHKTLRLHSVRVHETETGWAEADMNDVNRLWGWGLDRIYFSQDIRAEWQDPQMMDKLGVNIPFINPIVEVTHE